MENAVEALKIAFAVMMFVVALTLCISSFSSANEAITSIITMRDRETEYTYVEPSENLTRTVGIETVVTSMYRAYEQNIEIYFKESDGTPYKEISIINLATQGFATQEEAKQYLDDLVENVIYKHLKNNTFIEQLGEYYQGTGANQIKKRVITYIIK